MGIKDGEDLCPFQFLEYVSSGHKLADWFRAELELKAHTDKSLDWNIVADRDAYFTGAYPYLQEVFPNVKPEIVLRTQKMGALLVDAALANIRRQYGSTIFTALHHLGGDMSAVWDAICGDKHNERLVRSGALFGV
jgi:DNA relaxase NicK